MDMEHRAPVESTSALHLRLGSFRYADADHDTLRAIELELSPGSLTVISGDSGSGKSTFGGVLAGMLPRQGADSCEGTFILAGQRIDYSPEHSPRIDVAGWARHLGLLPQDAGLYLSRIRQTVAEELVFARENEGMPRKEMTELITEFSTRLSLEHLLERDPSKLSGGQERLVALTALSAANPSIIVLDEPLAGLDSTATATVTAMITRLRAAGTALVVLTRTTEAWEAEAETLLTLADGTLRPATRTARTAASSSKPSGFAAAAASEKPLLAFAGVQLGYKGASAPVISDLDLEVRAGECVGLAGANGTGKTTLLKAAAGLLKPIAGKLRVTAESGMLLQNPSDQLFERTVTREIAFGLPKKGLQRARVPRILEQLGLASCAQTHPYELPASARRLVALATVLVREPRLLLLDEPTEALDPAGLQILNEVIDSVLERGGAVLFSSHDERFIARTAHRVHRMPRQ
ncbi:ABC transporter ATP-binding protein [Glutamicibacter nicotianae]|uniref:ABC transporter ATP-binding protein n=3 Tax=Glutamicibacter nicotianae TaxID=37929 RepID=A0ABQ0RIE4_GLUNI|nr:ABC transporter ATP-binding protein [Glutamicibacter nicotianae]